MQGRLSPQVNGKIQAFPKEFWKDEFPLAQKNGFSLMEWTLDDEDLLENPLLTPEGQKEIQSLCEKYEVRIHSVTGDNIMQAPFYKAPGSLRTERLEKFEKILRACSHLGISYYVFPIVDDGRPETPEQEEVLLAELKRLTPLLQQLGVEVIFESEEPTERFLNFIRSLDRESFGVNYDIGNSASKGFDPVHEMELLGSYIKNVHIKDRLLGGTTVPLGTGNANFPLVFRLLGQLRYKGNYILQTARSATGEHEKALCQYRDQALEWMSEWI